MHSPVCIVALERMEEARREADQARLLHAAGLGQRCIGSVWQALLRRILGIAAAVQSHPPAAQSLDLANVRAGHPRAARD